MTHEIKKGDKTLYVCDECEFAYEKEELAKKCEAWCREKHSCNMEITKYSVEK